MSTPAIDAVSLSIEPPDLREIVGGGLQSAHALRCRFGNSSH